MFTRILTFIITLTLAFVGGLSGSVMAKDAHSYANVESVTSTHLHLDVTVNFDKQSLEGIAD